MNVEYKKIKSLLCLTIVSVSVFILLSDCTTRMTEAPLTYHLGYTGKIPTGYKTYTLFLSTSYDYIDNETHDKLLILERNFKTFGDSIGANNLAVWVNRKRSNALDVSRGKYYADLFSKYSGKSIEYSNGPFVILSSLHPQELSRENRVDKSNEGPIVIVIGFKNISSKRVSEILSYVEARIRREELHAQKAEMYILWIKMKSIWDKADKEFLKDVSLELISKIPTR